MATSIDPNTWKYDVYYEHSFSLPVDRNAQSFYTSLQHKSAEGTGVRQMIIGTATR
jgi:hypothetical protein